ncbi:MAG: hypothetical protein H0U38_07860 [Chloroflexia bacterium]|jgi:hypothetical protein|nr:hypothetical protein [Chloroflexia bacterium]
MNTRTRVTAIPALLAAGAFASLPGVLRGAAAQEATPEAGASLLSEFGFPEITITIENGEVTVPAEVQAGRVLIAYENIGDESSHPILMQPPAGVSADQMMADLGPEAMEPPEWFLDATFPGFVGETLPGETSYAVVDLLPGTHLVLDNAPFPFEVVPSDATPAAEQVPEADGVVRLFEMGFEFSEPLEPGRQVWEITNSGDLPHELLLIRSSAPVTPEQIIELFMSEDENATPVGGGPSLADIEPVGGLGWLSPGATAWTEVDLEPGTYAAVCFVFDPETGMPHLMLGMVDTFTVGNGGTPAATPAG